MIIKIIIIIHLFQLTSLSNITLIVKGKGNDKLLFGYKDDIRKFNNKSFP